MSLIKNSIVIMAEVDKVTFIIPISISLQKVDDILKNLDKGKFDIDVNSSLEMSYPLRRAVVFSGQKQQLSEFLESFQLQLIKDEQCIKDFFHLGSISGNASHINFRIFLYHYLTRYQFWSPIQSSNEVYFDIEIALKKFTDFDLPTYLNRCCSDLLHIENPLRISLKREVQIKMFHYEISQSVIAAITDVTICNSIGVPSFPYAFYNRRLRSKDKNCLSGACGFQNAESLISPENLREMHSILRQPLPVAALVEPKQHTTTFSRGPFIEKRRVDFVREEDDKSKKNKT